MDNIVARVLKVLCCTMVFISSLLCVFVKPGLEKKITFYNSSYIYNSIPYQKDILEVKENVLSTLYGTVTAYGPDCVGCSGITSSGYRVSEYVNGNYKLISSTYSDKTFGDLRILAAAVAQFPIGTVVRMSGSSISEPITGIVLDTGYAMNSAYKSGNVLIDLMFDSEKNKEVFEFGRKHNVKFEILRYGF